MPRKSIHRCESWCVKSDPRVKIFVAVAVFPFVGRAPRGVAAVGQRVGGRAEREHVEQERLVVALPAERDEAALGLPAVRQRLALVLRPGPVGAAIKRVGKGADLALAGRVGLEVGGGGQHAGQQEGAVHRRQLALPGTPPGPHVEEMIVEAPVAGGVGLGAVRAVAKKTQRRQRALHRGGASHESALDPHRVGRQREAGGGDAGGPVRRRLVEHQSVGGIGLVHEVAEGLALEDFQLVFDAQFLFAHGLGCLSGIDGTFHRSIVTFTASFTNRHAAIA